MFLSGIILHGRRNLVVRSISKMKKVGVEVSVVQQKELATKKIRGEIARTQKRNGVYTGNEKDKEKRKKNVKRKTRKEEVKKKEKEESEKEIKEKKRKTRK